MSHPVSHPVNETHRRIVEQGYDLVAERYLATKDAGDPATLSALEGLSDRLSPGAAVLDLGCGAGVPVTRWLAGRYVVTGVDVSARQLGLARQNAPEATFVKADMTALDFGRESFDAVVAFHSIIHVPRAEHRALLGSIHRWLKPGGYFLATLSVGAWEGGEADWEGWGAPMRWSHHDRDTNVRLLREAGFRIPSAEPRTTAGTGGDEEWLWVLARKPDEEE